MYIPRFVFNLISAEPSASFSLTPEGVVHFRATTGAFEAFVPCLYELLRSCAILTADSQPRLEVEQVPPPFDAIAGVSEVALLREAVGKRSVAVLSVRPSDRQAHALFELLPNVIAFAHPDGVLRAPIRPLAKPYADAPYKCSASSKSPRRTDLACEATEVQP